MQQDSHGRFSGRQIVVMVVAVCAAAVMFPVGVYAAAVNKVSIADASNPARTATVDSNGALGARPAPPTAPFHRGEFMSSTGDHILGAKIPQGKSLAISSVHVASLGPTPGHTHIVVRKASAGGTCSTSGPLRGMVSVIFISEDNAAWNATRVFPVPQIWTKTDRALCLHVDSPTELFVVVDGYTY